MARVLISSAHDEIVLENLLINSLNENAHDVLSFSVEIGREWRTEISNALMDVDAVIALVTKEYLHSNSKRMELSAILAFAENNQHLVVIPVIVGNIDPPKDLRGRQWIRIDTQDPYEIRSLGGQVNALLARQVGRSAAIEEKRREELQRLERSAAEFVDDSLQELRLREKKLERHALFWYWMGYVAIAVGVFASAALAFLNLPTFLGDVSNWGAVALIIVKGVVLIGLLLAASRYGFSLAKAYMDEALKNADRIHAISFGKFYLRTFGDKAEASDVKDVFRHWNVSRSNSFSVQQTADFDPKILEAAFEIVKIMRGAQK